jgi:hypothetical protein
MKRVTNLEPRLVKQLMPPHPKIIPESRTGRLRLGRHWTSAHQAEDRWQSPPMAPGTPSISDRLFVSPVVAAIEVLRRVDLPTQTI